MARRKAAAAPPVPMPQTGQLFASSRNDITVPQFTDVLQPRDDILLLKGGGKGIAIYDEVARDAHAYAVLTKRKHQLVARPWVVAPGGETARDIEAADFVREAIDALPFDQITLDLLDATLKGYAVSEIVWEKADGKYWPVEMKQIDQQRILFDRDWLPRLRTLASPFDGEELPARKFVVHRFGVRGNDPYGRGLGAILYWPVHFKRHGVGFWMRFLERFGSPIPVGKYPQGSLPAVIDALESALLKMHSASVVTLPLGTEVDSFEAKRSGTVDYADWARYWNAEISKAVLGETLTTESDKNGARAASETHADMLDMLVDADGDLLSGSLRSQLLTWMIELNYPGAAVPNLWRPRPASAREEEALRKARAERIAADLKALETAREAGFEPAEIEAWVAEVFGTEMVAVAPKAKASPFDPAGAEAPAFAAATETDVLVEQLSKIVAPVHRRWLDELRTLTGQHSDLGELSRALAAWVAAEVPDYGPAIGDAIVDANLSGRASVNDEKTGESGFAGETGIGTVDFKERREFLRQKVALPTHSYTDLLHQGHDRGFVVAGADRVELVEDLKDALMRSMEKGGIEAFRADFDNIAERYGWSYNGGRNWRTRVIWETNLRTSYMAGRLAQMRDPEVLKARPFWRYVHGETREPKQPRAEHLAWDGKIFAADDPIWQVIYPPNGWRCSCGVQSISHAMMRRLGKDGPDPAPALKMRKIEDPKTGELIDYPEGIDFGWAYQPGDTWERGLVPRMLQEPLPTDQPGFPVPDVKLKTLSRPFVAGELPAGKPDEFYVEAFLGRFGAAIGRGVLFRDKAGQAVLISDQLMRNAAGAWKVGKRERAIQMERLAEAIFDPDEIWLDWAQEQSGAWRLVRRYLRYDPDLAGIAAFHWSHAGWWGDTAFASYAGKKPKPSATYLEGQRHGALLYRRRK